MKTAIISPSGKFYGSEQTLFEFLSRTKGYDVYIKYEKNGLYDRLKSANFEHRYYKYQSLLLYYLLFSLKLLFQYNKVYINEGGHSKYITLLAKLFSWKTFYIHVRLTEDTATDRWSKLSCNVHLISTSKYIADLLLQNIKTDSIVISSPARAFKEDFTWNFNYHQLKIKKIGIIGRLTISKGVSDMHLFLNYLEQRKCGNYQFYFYGDIDADNQQVKCFLAEAKLFNYVEVFFEGFVNEKSVIYSNLDLVLHFNRKEPLGVIFLESINQGIPFVGFNSGGIGVIAEHLNLGTSMVSTSEHWCEEMVNVIEKLDIHEYMHARGIMLQIYSPEVYCKKIQHLIN